MIDIAHATDHDIHENVEEFRAALKAQEPKLRNPTIERVLLAVDQSNQGRTSERFASVFARTNKARILLIYAYEGVRNSECEKYLAARAQALTEADIELEPLDEPIRTEHGLRSFEQILQTAETKECDLIVVPAPYLDDYVKLGCESVGVNLDILMSRSNVPLLVVRDPKIDPEESLKTVFLLVTPHSNSADIPAAWALKLAKSEGILHCVAVADPSELKELGEIRDLDIAEIDLKIAAGLTHPKTAGLIGALQRQASERSLNCHVSVHSHADLVSLMKDDNDDSRLFVLGSSTDSESLVFQRIQTLIRTSRNPVLLVTKSSRNDTVTL
ncbi:MAG: hypothetical protein NMNS01_16600 [Nitrosomonas sp.]|nr:MAG: hypothetical protein NMNS01_16600 [Nitrosomonas sp.]